MGVIITEPETIYFDSPRKVGNSLKHEIGIIIKPNGFLVDHTIKNEVTRFLSKYKRGNDIHEYQK